MSEKPKVITLCGSSRFVGIMAVTAWLLEKYEGAITMGLHLLPSWYSAEHIPDHLAEHEGVASAMDELHLRKIDISDEVFVIDFDSYIGESTSREMCYAIEKVKLHRFLQTDYIGSYVYDILARSVGLPGWSTFLPMKLPGESNADALARLWSLREEEGAAE